MKTLRERFDEKWMPEPFSGCWLWTAGVDAKGYGRIGALRKNQKAQRIAWQLYRGDIPCGLSVLHKCDVRCCVNPEHLFLGDNADNTYDMIAKCRHYRKLKDCDVLVIKQSPPRLGGKLARRFNVSAALISRIRLGHLWKHIQ